MEKARLAGHFALDVAQAGTLSTRGAQGASGASLREAAEQFEAMFLEKMLSSARQAHLKSELGRGPQLDFYESLMDKQWAQHMAGREGGLGLADQIVRQISSAQGYQGGAESADIQHTTDRDRLK